MADKPVQRKVRIYSTYPSYSLVLQPNVTAQRENDKGQIADVVSQPEVCINFVNHRAQIDAELLPLLKSKPWYGTDFLEASELRQRIKDKRADVFVNKMSICSKRGGVMPPIEPMTFAMELASEAVA